MNYRSLVVATALLATISFFALRRYSPQPKAVENSEELSFLLNNYPAIDYSFSEKGLEIACRDADGIQYVGNWEVLLTVDGAPYRYIDGLSTSSLDRVVRSSENVVGVTVPHLHSDAHSWFKRGYEYFADKMDLGYRVFFSYIDGKGLAEKAYLDILLQ